MLNRSEIRLGDVLFDTETRDLRAKSGERIELRNKSSEVLAVLAKSPGEIVSKTKIMEAVWPGVTVSDESLTQCVSDIRRAIDDKDQSIVVTHVGKGFSLSVEPPVTRTRMRSFSVLAAICLLLLAGVATWWVTRPQVTPDAAVPRIAILAFDDLSAGDEKGWLGDGIAEGVITELARYREFLVIARNSSFSFRDQSLDVTDIASQLDADYILEGSKQKSGDRLRVTAQLLNGRDATHIWAHEFDADIGDLFDVQSQIVRSISVGIGRKLAHVPPRTGGRDSVSALHYYHLGRSSFSNGSPDAYGKARDLYELSIETDPDAPFGYAGMATLIWADASQGWVFKDMARDDLLEMGIDYAEKAIAADPTYYQSHIARGDLYSSAGEHQNAVNSYQKAAELNPSSSEAMMLSAEPLLYLDRADEAIAVAERAIEINPVTPDWYYNIYSRVLWWAGRCEEGVETIKKRAQMRPWDYRALIMNLVCLDRMDEARAAGEKIMDLDPDFNLGKHAKRIVGINFPEYEERWLDNLRSAGLPEH